MNSSVGIRKCAHLKETWRPRYIVVFWFLVESLIQSTFALILQLVMGHSPRPPSTESTIAVSGTLLER